MQSVKISKFKCKAGFTYVSFNGEAAKYILPIGFKIYNVVKKGVQGIRVKFNFNKRCIDTFVTKDFGDAYIRFLHRVSTLTIMYKGDLKLNWKAFEREIPLIYDDNTSYWLDDPLTGKRIYVCGSRSPNAKKLAWLASDKCLETLIPFQVKEVDYVRR